MDANDAPRELLTQLYFGAIATLQPAAAVTRALDGIWNDGAISEPLHVLAIGKAAGTMARAAQAWCDTRRITIAGGVEVSHQSDDAATGTLSAFTGDHPTPAVRSRVAAEALGTYVASRIAHGDHVIVLLSGGASALIGAPRAGVDAAQYVACIDALLGSGLTIDDMNAVRRQLSRWAGGRLGEALLARGARVNVLVISDVIGDSLAAIGSGPCIIGRSDRIVVESILMRAQIPTQIRGALREMLSLASIRDARVFVKSDIEIPHKIISSNRQARFAVLRLAREAGAAARKKSDGFLGDAHLCGSLFASRLVVMRKRSPPANNQPLIVCWGGEPTIALPTHNAPRGGRMQAFALSAAQTLHEMGSAAGITILAAGTDGRDGTTDAAGAIVDGSTWRAIGAKGRDAASDLAEFRSYDALKAIDALIPSFVSGTNVNDLVIALIEPPAG